MSSVLNLSSSVLILVSRYLIQKNKTMDFWKIFPEKSKLLKWYAVNGDGQPRLVNAHIHSPYSNSDYDGIPQVLDKALAENVRVVGINDYYSTDGFAKWAEECLARKLFPLFNSGYVSLNREDQTAGITVNDPNNPGRTILSGKGLAFPPRLEEPFASVLETVRNESNNRIKRMCGELNRLLKETDTGFDLDYDVIRSEMTRGMVRESHLAKALRRKVSVAYASEEEQRAFYLKIFGGKALESEVTNAAAVENEIRGNLFNAGGAAFIPESPEALPDMEMVCRMIRNAGGIPTYQFLADDANGKFTEFEASKERVAETLMKRNIWSVEFITPRNSLEVLEEYACYFYQKGFVVTFGSGNINPAIEPIDLTARGGRALTPLLIDINYQGACLIAAHQYLTAINGKGYLDADGRPDLENRESYIVLGEALIEFLLKSFL